MVNVTRKTNMSILRYQYTFLFIKSFSACSRKHHFYTIHNLPVLSPLADFNNAVVWILSLIFSLPSLFFRPLGIVLVYQLLSVTQSLCSKAFTVLC